MTISTARRAANGSAVRYRRLRGICVALCLTAGASALCGFGEQREDRGAPAAGTRSAKRPSDAASRQRVAVVGRAVDGFGRPSPHAELELVWANAGGATSYYKGTSDEDGRFRINVNEASVTPTWCRLDVSPAGGRRWGILAAHPIDVASGFDEIRDVGDVEAGAGRTITLNVVDEEGEPIPHARLNLPNRASGPEFVGLTDALGRWTSIAPFRPIRIIVSGWHVEGTEVDLPEDALAEVRATVRRSPGGIATRRLKAERARRAAAGAPNDSRPIGAREAPETPAFVGFDRLTKVGCPRFVGRAVDANGAGVAKAEIRIFASKNEPRRSMSAAVHTDVDGRFEFAVRYLDFWPDALRVAVGPSGSGVATSVARSYAVDLTVGFEDVRDLGDLVCGVGRRVVLEVVDEAGVPMPGASLGERKAPDGYFGDTDAAGRAALTVPFGPVAIPLRVRGYEPSEAELPEIVDGVVRVVLKRQRSESR